MGSDRIDEAFGGLDDDDDKDDQETQDDGRIEETVEDQASTTETEKTPSRDERSASTSDDATSSSAASQDGGDNQGDIQSKAFPYADAKQSPIYARPDAWDDYEDTLEIDVERELRDLGVRNAQKRELNEAMLLVAAENPDLVVEKFLEIRRER
jgi:hypothetical protein